jgi:hypothetical protein
MCVIRRDFQDDHVRPQPAQGWNHREVSSVERSVRIFTGAISMKAMKFFLILGTAYAGLSMATTAGSAMPLSVPSLDIPVQQARTVCNPDGRCWNEHRNAVSVLGLERRHEYIGRWQEHRHDWHDHDHYRHDHGNYRRDDDAGM